MSNCSRSTQSLLNDLERAVDDSVACVRGLCRDPRFVPGGGATEMELAHQIFKHGESQARADTSTPFPWIEQNRLVANERRA